MNLPKKLILLPTIALIFVGGGVAAYALKPEVEPKRVEVQQVAAVEPQEVTEPVESPPAVVEEQEPVPEPPKTPDEIEAEAQAKVEQYAASRGWDVLAQGRCLTLGEGIVKGLLSEGSTYEQTMKWIDDHFITGLPVAGGEATYPGGTPADSGTQGTKRIRYDGSGTCRLLYYIEQN